MRRTVGDVMRSKLVTTGPATPFRELARLLCGHELAGLVVVDTVGRPLGVVEACDLAGHLNSVPGPARLTAADVMRTPVVSVRRELPAGMAAALLRDGHPRRLLVVYPGGGLAGVVTATDLLQVYLRPDGFIRDEILDRIDLLPRFHPGSVRVQVHDGDVLLTGTVERLEEVEHVRELAGCVDGVVSVEEQLEIRPAGRVPAVAGAR
jgi:CBS domain-containing protein